MVNGIMGGKKMNKYQISVDYLKEFSDGYDEIGDPMHPYEYGKRYKLCIDTLQELIDICSKPNSIKQKLDHIQDVIDCCYETDINGKHYESDWNDDVCLADEELQEIKQAYSFRVEDTRIVNELQELLGGGVDFLKKKVQELIDNYEKLETKCFDLEQELELVYGDSNEELEDSLIECDIKCQKLEKELDMACEILSSLSSCDCLHKRLYENKIFKGSDRKEYVKKTIEYLLKESEKQ